MGFGWRKVVIYMACLSVKLLPYKKVVLFFMIDNDTYMFVFVHPDAVKRISDAGTNLSVQVRKL